MAYTPLLSGQQPRSAIDELMGLNATTPAAGMAAVGATTPGPAWSPGMPAPAPGTPGYADYQAYAAGQANAGAAASAAGNVAATAHANANPAPGVTSPTGVTGLVTPSPNGASDKQPGYDWNKDGVISSDEQAVYDPNLDGVVTQEEAYGRQQTQREALNDESWKGSLNNPYIASTLGTNTYELGGRSTFTSELSGALQANANQAAQGINAAGQTAQATAAQGGAALQAGGAALNDYGLAQGAGVQSLGQGLTDTGYALGQQAQDAQGRVAPGLDTSAQNTALGYGLNTLNSQYGAAQNIGATAGQAIQAGQAAAGRAAPTQDTTGQNAALGLAGTGAQALAGNAATATQAGYDAGNRSGPNLDFSGANTALTQAGNDAQSMRNAGATAQTLASQSQSRTGPTLATGAQDGALNAVGATANNLGSAAEQALSLGQQAATRGGVAADYGSSRSALDQLMALEGKQGPTGAEALLRQGSADSMAQSLALARSGRGYGGNAQGMTEALRSNAATMQTVENQAALLRANEDAAYRTRAAQNLTTGAGMLSGQAQQDQSAALQSRAQNDAAMSSLLGLGAQSLGTQGNLQQQTAQQYGQQATTQAQLSAQQNALNDAQQQNLMQLGLQANQGAAGVAQQTAAQVSDQQRAAAATAQQQTALNDAARQGMLGIGLQGQTAAIGAQQANAAQLGQQAQFNVNAAQQQTAMNDSALGQLMGLGLQGQTAEAGQYGQIAAAHQASAAQYGQQAALNQQAALQQSQQNDAYSTALQQASLQGLQSGVNAQATGAQIGMAGLESGLGIYGQGVNTALTGNQLAAQSAASAAGLQQNALTQTGQLAQIQSGLRQAQVDSMLTEYGIDQGVAAQRQNSDNALLGAGLSAAGTALAAGAMAMSDVRAKKRIKPALREELFLSPGDSLLAPSKPAPEKSALEQLSGEEVDAIASRYGLDYRRPANMPRRYVSNGPAEDPGDFGEYEQSPVLMSDEREKTDLRAAKGYSYEYKDPARHGQGRFVGPMAQDLLKTGAKDAVVEQPGGRYAVDTGRLALRTTSAVSQQQRELDMVNARLEELEGRRKKAERRVTL